MSDRLFCSSARLSLLILAVGCASATSKPAPAKAELKCFAGKLEKQPVQEIRIALSDSPDVASRLIFKDGKAKHSTDLLCLEGFIGPCSIHDDGGTIQILSVGDQRIEVQLTGAPKLRRQGDDVSPMVEPAKLKLPLKVELAKAPASDCSY